MEDEVDYAALQNDLRRAWEDMEYAHLWLTAFDWDASTNINDKLTAAQQKARQYTELVDRIAWSMRR
jgi:hypothetical protein